MRRLTFITILALTAVLTAVAQVSFNVIPPRNVVAGERFNVVYRLTNAQGTSLKAPQIDGCSMLYGPATSTSHSMQIVNGQTTSKSTVDYTYTYRADSEGTFTIPAASIVADGRTLTSDAASFKVLPADKASSRRQQQQRPSSPFDDFDDFDDFDLPSTSSTPEISNQDIFVRVILNKTTAYEQEAIEYTLKLYTRYEAITSFAAATPASNDGFLIDDIPVQAQLNDLEHYNGKNYRTAVLKRAIIFPQKTGRLTLSTGSYKVTVRQLEKVSNGYFYMSRPVDKDVTLPSTSVTVTAKPLPAGAPAGFNGAVGQYKASARLSSDKLRTGEAASLVYTVSGSGNIKYLDTPKIDFPAEFEQYSPKQDFDTRVAGATIAGTMTVEYTFVPSSVGKYELALPPFSFFNPSTGKYESADMPSYTIDVAKGVGGSASDVERRDVTVKNTDILHIKLGDKGQSLTRSFVTDHTWYWLAYLLLLAVLIGAIVSISRRNKANADVAGRLKRRADAMARRRLSAASRCLRSGHPEQVYDAILKALWGYMSEKLAIPASELTRSNISDQLTSHGASPELTEKTIALLDDCEMARYTPQAAAAPEDAYRRATDIIRQLQTIKKPQ